MLKIKENIGKSILKLTLEKIFIGNDTRSTGKKKKDKWDYIKLKNFHTEGNHKQNEKVTYWMGEDICKLCI